MNTDTSWAASCWVRWDRPCARTFAWLMRHSATVATSSLFYYPKPGKEAALLVARRLMGMFRTREWLAGEGFSQALRASIGIACYPSDGGTAQELVHRADELMYQVKQSGRDNIAVTGLGLVGAEEP